MFALLFCVVNLLLMHYAVVSISQLEIEENYVLYIDNCCGAVFDVCVIFMLSYLISGKRWRQSWMATFVITLAWSFSSVLYSRFFFHYLTLSSIGQGGTLFDWLMVKCMVEKLEWMDWYYPLALLLFLFLMRRMPEGRPAHVVRNTVMGIALLVVVEIMSLASYCMSKPEYRYLGYFTYKFEQYHVGMHSALCEPVATTFRRGVLRTLGAEIADMCQGTIELSAGQKEEIAQSVRETKESMQPAATAHPKNLIFILVESYMSFVSDMKVGEREVTPFLNALKRDSTVYFNGSMTPNITIGESSDGQFIYLTGLLPLRSVITISKAKGINLPGLPKQFKRHSRMIIPTLPSMWNQDKMCERYGFDELYSSADFEGGSYTNLNDEQVFQLAMQKDKEGGEPFFSMVLTISMHQPYTEQIDPSFIINDNTISRELACYLNACHYTDAQIERYFQFLKSEGLFDESVIVITSDHHVHSVDFGHMEIPLYVVNGNMRNARQGTCQQVDVYTTLLDVMGVKSSWCGLGQSLLSPTYSEKELKWDVAEWIIRSDYFAQFER